MKKTDNFKKLKSLKEPELYKEIAAMQFQVLNLRIDIANRKTKGIHRISELRSSIARAKTIISAKDKEKNGS